jgi:hypothetical protein
VVGVGVGVGVEIGVMILTLLLEVGGFVGVNRILGYLLLRDRGRNIRFRFMPIKGRGK